MVFAEFSIPAIRGTQGGHAFYTAMCPIRLLPKLFPVGAEQATGVAHQSFRTAIPSRVREIARAVVTYEGSFHLAAVTVSVEHKVRFHPAGDRYRTLPTTGELLIPLEARMTIVDGIHRIYGLQRALKERASLAEECVAMVIYIDPDGSRRGQIFSDIKRHERSSAQSLLIGLDDRDEVARLTRAVIASVPIFVDAIEMEKTAISNRSRKLFTLSALYHANQTLLADRRDSPYDVRVQAAIEFWTEVSALIPDWMQVVKGPESAAEIRAAYVHCHAIGIAAIARAGRALFEQAPNGWKKRLRRLSSLNWSRANKSLWEGRAMIGGRLSKSSSAVARAGNAVKLHLGLKLSREEQAIEA